MTVQDDNRSRSNPIERRRVAGGAVVELPDAWWPIAFGHAVTTVPVAARLATTPLCLYRDAAGDVRAVLDACPHRRLPLSMGRVTPEGDIQCGYHGWCFDGASGRCTAIPNLSADERVSPSIRVRAFTTAEQIVRRRDSQAPRTTRLAADDSPEDALTMFATSLADGFVHVWTGDGATPDTSTTHEPAATPQLVGEFEARAPHALVAEVLATTPGPALGLGMILGAGEEVVRPTVDGAADAIRIERERRLLDLPRASTYEPRGRRTVLTTSTSSVVTGLTTIDAERDDGAVRARVVAALTPVGGYRTIVRWHATVDGRTATRLAGRAAAEIGRRRRPERRLERLADGLAADAVDPGVEQLRARRSTR